MGETPPATDLTGATLLGDSELVVRARRGDRRAFGTLYLRHHDAAWRVACTSAKAATDAEDAVAEGFAKVFAALPRMVDRELAFRPYLLACVRNAAIDRHRREKKLDFRGELPDRPTARSAPDELVLADLERNLVGEALKSLPERWRTVLWLTEVEGMTPSEVSAVIGIKPNAVAALSYRAREGLREAYLQAHLRAEARAECRYTVDRLGPYVRNELADRERERVQAHLDRCVSCRQRRDELADVNASLLGALVPVPLLLGSRTQQEWLSVAHLGKGTRRAKAPAKAAKTAKLGSSMGIQATLATIVALLLAISSGVAVQRFGSVARVGKAYDSVAIPKATAPPAPAPTLPSGPVEVAAPPVAAPPVAPPVAAPRTSDADLVFRPRPRPALQPAPTVDAPASPVEAPSEPASPSEPLPPNPPPIETPPPTPPPSPPAFAAAAASIGEGANGAVLALAVPQSPQNNPQPDLDLTLGNTPLVGNAAPSKGTAVELSLNPQIVQPVAAAAADALASVEATLDQAAPTLNQNITIVEEPTVDEVPSTLDQRTPAADRAPPTFNPTDLQPAPTPVEAAATPGGGVL